MCCLPARRLRTLKSMACRISELVLNCADPELLAGFWSEVLGYVELDRLLALGARPADVGQTGDEQWHVLADPEGNEFCLLRRRLEP